MSIEPGRTLLHYRVERTLGEGGMGVVWQAVDTNLDRPVAIKVLPAGFAADAERLARFEREAKLLASLQHPNIAVVHGLHREGDLHFLAMELVPGEDLAERVLRGPLDADDAVRIAVKIAEGVAAAHDSGVVHRDLKPANIRVTPDEHVKVLDFGLAKSMEPGGSSGSPDPALSPTVTSVGSVAGVVLGTAAYMSPEQARGKPVDRRADVWAFGCVLFELLTGRCAFPGETVSDMIAAILAREPDWNLLPSTTPPAVRRVLRDCLRKDPRERKRDLADVALELRRAEGAQPIDRPVRAAPAAGSRGWQVATALCALVAVASLATLAVVRRSGPGTDDDVRVTEMKVLVDEAGAQRSPALSPDGKSLLYVARRGPGTDIFVQRVGGENPVNLTAASSEDDFDPEFSPDGERIAFCSEREDGGIFVMGATGESPRRVAATGFDPSWSPDGNAIVFTTERVLTPYSRSSNAQLFVLDLETSKQRRLEGIADAVGPRFSPDGRRIAFWGVLGGQRDLWTVPAAGGEPVAVTADSPTDWAPFWSPDGGWLYFISDRGGSPDLWRVEIDRRTGGAAGTPRAVTTGVARVWEASMAVGTPRIAVEINNDIGEMYRMTLDESRTSIVGEPVAIRTGSEYFEQVDVSRDGRWVSYHTSGARENLMIMRIDGTERRQLTDDVFRNRGPVWSPDGEWIAMYSNREGAYELYAMRRDGTGLRRLTEGNDSINDPVFSPDGSTLAVSFRRDGNRRLAFIDLPSRGLADVDAPLPLRAPPGEEPAYPDAWSPDGERILATTIGLNGEPIQVVYLVDENRYEVPIGPENMPYATFEEGAGWIDSDRFLVIDTRLRTAFVHDLRTRSFQAVPEIPVPSNIAVGGDGSTVVCSRRRGESDIWLVTLEEQAEANRGR